MLHALLEGVGARVRSDRPDAHGAGRVRHGRKPERLVVHRRAASSSLRGVRVGWSGSPAGECCWGSSASGMARSCGRRSRGGHGCPGEDRRRGRRSWGGHGCPGEDRRGRRRSRGGHGCPVHNRRRERRTGTVATGSRGSTGRLTPSLPGRTHSSARATSSANFPTGRDRRARRAALPGQFLVDHCRNLEGGQIGQVSARRARPADPDVLVAGRLVEHDPPFEIIRCGLTQREMLEGILEQARWIPDAVVRGGVVAALTGPGGAREGRRG